MDQHTLQVLEFQKICQLVSQETLSPMGREEALAISPMTDREQIFTSLQQVTELTELFQRGIDFPLERFEDIRPGLAKCRHGGSVLETEEFLHVSHILLLCRNLVRFEHDHSKECPRLEASIGLLETLEPLRKKIDEKIDEKGQVRDTASRKLHDLRVEKDTTRDRILSKMRSLLSSSAAKNLPEDDVITLRDGRYVIPVRGNQRRADGCSGIGQPASGSGIGGTA
jgi:DNA mismatch repair protein MutS2